MAGNQINLPALPSSVEPGVRRAFEAVRMALQQLQSAQAASSSTTNIYSNTGEGGVIIDNGLVVDPAIVSDIPPQVTGLVATGGFNTIILEWTDPAYAYLAYAEIVRSTTNNIGEAIEIATSNSNMYADTPPDASLSVTYYYWVRLISIADVAGPWSAVSVDSITGLPGASTADDPAYMLELMKERLGYGEFGPGVYPVRVVSELPALPDVLYPANVMVYLVGETLAESHLYRTDGSTWTDAIPATIISGQLTDEQLAEIAAAKISGQLTSEQIAAIEAAKVTGQIVGVQIADDAITAAKIAANTITAAEIAAYTITALQIAGATITGAKLVAGTITTSHIASDTITAANIAANAITATELAADAVTATKILAGAITAGKIAAGAIVAGDGVIGTAAIATAHIVNAGITNAKIANLAVDSAKIADATIVAAKIANAAITEAKIGTAAVTNAKIANAAITEAKIANAAITAAKIGTAAVGTLSVAGNAITANVLALNLSGTALVTGIVEIVSYSYAVDANMVSQPISVNGYTIAHANYISSALVAYLLCEVTAPNGSRLALDTLTGSKGDALDYTDTAGYPTCPYTHYMQGWTAFTPSVAGTYVVTLYGSSPGVYKNLWDGNKMAISCGKR